MPSLRTTFPSLLGSKEAAGSMPRVPPVWMSKTRGKGLVTTSNGPGIADACAQTALIAAHILCLSSMLAGISSTI